MRLLRWPGALAGVLIGLAACVPTNQRTAFVCSLEYEPWIELIRGHSSPAMTPDDVYKLVHQGLAGPGHAAPSRGAATAWMLTEIAELRNSAGGIVPLPGEPLLVPVRPDSSIVRVNLRPWMAASGNPDVLLDAFLETADAIHPSPSQLAGDFAGVTECLLKAVVAGDLRLDEAELERTFTRAVKAGHPAGHHSEQYRSAYRPSYRVVERSRLALVGWGSPTDKRGPAK